MYKVALVDDEAIVRKGMLNLIPWDQLGCEVVCEASDGLELLEALRHAEPDIIITDVKMPRMDGLALCGWLRENRPQVQIIMLTAYADFEYARQGMKYGVTDYVTKSGGMKEVTAAVQHAIEQMEERRLLQSQAELHRVNLEALQRTFLKNVFDGLWTEQGALYSRASQLHFELEQHTVLCMECDLRQAAVPQKSLNSLDPVADLLTIAFQGYRCWCVPISNMQLAIVLSPAKDASMKMAAIVSACKQLLRVLNDLLGCSVFIGVGPIGSHLPELAQTYYRAREALNRRFLEDKSRLYFYGDNERTSPNGFAPVNRAIDRLVTAVGTGDVQTVSTLLEELFKLQKQSNIPAEVLKSQAMGLNARCGRLLAERRFAQDNIYQREVQFYKAVTACRSLEEYKRVLTPVVLETCRQLCCTTGTVDPVLLAKEYVQKNYVRDITLNDVASAIHVSPSYLSRLYKEATGSTVMADVAALKIEHAKQVLRQPGATVQSAAAAIGMEDPAYFSHFFKKHVGLSPKKFQLQ